MIWQNSQSICLFFNVYTITQGNGHSFHLFQEKMSDSDDFMMEEDQDFDFEYESGQEEEEGNVDLENTYYSAKGTDINLTRVHRTQG